MNERDHERIPATSAARRRRAGRPRPSCDGKGSRLTAEVRRGAAVGVGAGAVLVLIADLAWMAGGSTTTLFFAALGSGGVGALIGLLLWLGSSDLPGEPVPPPAPGRPAGLPPDSRL